MLGIEVHGYVDSRFSAVREVFCENFARGELGAACAVLRDGQVVVDVWGGWADDARTRPWTSDTIVNAYSVGKPLVALEVLQLVAKGNLELDAPATRWWPELLAGQQGATVRQILCHQAGVPAVRRQLSNSDLWEWDAMTRAIAETEPWWAPRDTAGLPLEHVRLPGGRARSSSYRPDAWRMASGMHRCTSRRRCCVGRAPERSLAVCRCGVARTAPAAAFSRARSQLRPGLPADPP